MEKRNCNHCHTCGGKMRRVLDGEEWCDTCQTYRRYESHGWGSRGEDNPCPQDTAEEMFSKVVDNVIADYAAQFGLAGAM